jgi:hypothetical protein
MRSICPSCGQGADPAAPPLASVPAHDGGGYGGAASGMPAAISSLMPGLGGGGAAAAAGSARSGMAAPGTNAWINRHGTLRRVSIGLRADQVWATERRSMDRRLGAMSVMSVYE